ncbi:MAG: DMT family transporter [Chitinophagaceae bacterium]
MFKKIQQKESFLLVGIILSMLIWGISWPSAKVLTRYGAPLDIAILRFAFTVLSVCFILFFSKTSFRITKQGWIPLSISSVLMAGYSLLFFTGIQKGMPGAGGVLVTTMTPIVTFFIAVIVSKRKLAKQEKIGLLVGLVAGVFLLKLWANASHIFESGNLFFIASTFLWAILSRFTAKSRTYGSPLGFSFWIYVFCVLILLCFSNPLQIMEILKNGDTLFWMNLIFNGMVNTGMATTFYFFATSKLGAEKTSSFIYIVPFAAAFFSFLLLQEHVAWNTILGGLLGVSAVWMINKKK